MWLFLAACLCREAGLSPEEAIEFISSRMTRPPSPWCEVQDAVRSAYRHLGEAPAAPRKPAWPTRDEPARESCAAGNGGLGRLADLSPDDANIWMNGGLPTLRRLFPGDPWICCGSSAEKFYTHRLSSWGPSIDRMRLVVPNPMTGPEGVTQSGRISAHSLSNTGPRRFLVVEQDTGSLDLQAGVLLELSKTAPLALVVHSGNKSIHGWFFCEGQPEDTLLKWFRGAVALGADPKMWTRSQFSRLPGGMRENGTVQRTLFFNPNTLQHS